MSQRTHVRSSSHGRKLLAPHPKTPKAALLYRRGHSYNNVQTQGHSQALISRPVLGGSKKTGVEVETEDQDDEPDGGMASFLQFCATCEKQIITPESSILYCSEVCRRKDASKLPSLEMTCLSSSLTQSASSHFEYSPTDILPQRSPTILRPASLIFSDFAISEDGSQVVDTENECERRESEEARYLALFRSEAHGDENAVSRRPRAIRASTAAESTLPSLVNTPSSSIGTVASVASYRPLPPRHDPLTSHLRPKSADLVTPCYPTTAPLSPTQLVKDASLKSSASTLTSFHAAEAVDVSCAGRKSDRRRSSQAHSSVH